MLIRAAFSARRCALLLLLAVSPALAQPPEGYRNYEQFHAEAKRLAESDAVSLSALGQTGQGRDVALLTLSNGDADQKPAVLIMGSVAADNLVGSHLALSLVELAAQGELAELLDEVTLYVIPRPSPDASERLFATTLMATAANHRPTDDDRDGEVDEDPPEDLNDDGLITMMRVAQPGGEYRVHPDEPRVMIKADPAKGEHGTHRLLIEGLDSDGDERWNEDGPGGVDFNRNFTFRYPYFKPGAGPHQVSEPETRAVADFAYDHANIFLVFSFAPQDNLNHEWKGKADSGRIKRKVQSGDAKHLKRIAESFRKLMDSKDAPPAADGEGAFMPWAYFHYGRWSLAARGWWPPKSDIKQQADSASDDDDSPESDEADQTAEDADDKQPTDKKSAMKSEDKKKATPEKRGADDVRVLQWLDAQGIAGFVDWKEVTHPDFPGQLVEVGGFKPAARVHPPMDQLDAGPWLEFLSSVAKDRARLELLSAEATVLGDGVVRVEAEVVNRGKLPTVSEMGQTTRRLQRLAIELQGPEGMSVLAAPRRQDLGALAPGATAERSWLVMLPEGSTIDQLSVRAGEPSVGFVDSKVKPIEDSP